MPAAEIAVASGLCQRWNARRHSWRHRSEGGFDSRRYEVATVPEAEARSFVVANHYAASYPVARLRYAIYHGPMVVGVAVLSVPVQAAVLTAVFPDLVPYYESLELGRFVLADEVPANAESWFLARAFELAAVAGVRGVVSFSDPVARRTSDDRLVFPGHVGIVYQASNAVYTGRSTRRTFLLLPDGTELNTRALSKVRASERGHEYVEKRLRAFGAPPRRAGEDGAEWLRSALLAAGVRRVQHPGCHRYAFTLGSQAERRAVRVATTAGSYPKVLE